MFLAEALADFYTDLADERFISGMQFFIKDFQQILLQAGILLNLLDL